MDIERKNTNDPTATLQRAIRMIERVAFVTSIILVIGTASYLSIHSWT